MRKFLSCPFLLLLPLLFCSCGRISEQCLLIDSADTCRVTTDQKVTLIRNGLPHDYHMPSTKDFFNGQTLSSSDISADSCRKIFAGRYFAFLRPVVFGSIRHRMRRILLPSNRQTDHDNRRLHPGHAVFCFRRRENLVFCHGRNTLGKRRFMHSS